MIQSPSRISSQCASLHYLNPCTTLICPLCVWLVSGKTAPRLITKDMVDLLRPGAVTVDLAAEVNY